MVRETAFFLVSVASMVLACGGRKAPETVGGPVVVTVPAPTPAPPPPADTPEPPSADGPPSCRPGMVRQERWPGEWPSPILHFTTAVAVEGVADPCTTAPTVRCTVAEGVYHPWMGPEQTARYASLSKRAVYRSTRGFNLSVEGGPRSFPAGTRVYWLGYLAEGFCTFWVEGQTVEWLCPEVGDDPDGPGLEVVEAGSGAAVQLLGAMCEDIPGTRIWVEVDDALQARPEVAAGVYLEYGRVGPSGHPDAL